MRDNKNKLGVPMKVFPETLKWGGGGPTQDVDANMP